MTPSQPAHGNFPAGRHSALCLTFDLDGTTMWTSKDPANARRPAVLSAGAYDVGEGLDLVLALLQDHDLRVTFFVPTDIAEAQPATIEKIVSLGHEIGMHGDDHTALRDRSRAAEIGWLRGLKLTLERISGTNVNGYRAPLYDVTDHTRDVLAELGCTYSSNYMDSIRPYLVRVPHGQIVELPVQWLLDDGPHLLFANSPPNYRQFISNSQILEMWTDELNAIHALGGATVLTLHPQLIGRPSRIGILSKLLAAADDLGSVWFPSAGELAQAVLDGSD